MRLLTLTTLYPNEAMPSHGIFVENRLRDFIERKSAQVTVIAPVPWFPLGSKVFGKYGDFSRVPLSENRFGISIGHPRYAIPPKIGMTYAPFALARCFLKSALEEQRLNGDFDVIDAHYLYPDGVAAVEVAKRLKKPVVLTARGSDVSQIMNYSRQRQMIIQSIFQADAVVCVAQSLKDKLVEYGAPPDKIDVLRNGVDLETFICKDTDSARKKFDVSGKVVAVVGHLIDRKGPDLILRAMEGREDVTVLFAGDGPKRSALQKLSNELGVNSTFLGSVPHHELVDVYNAADCLALASDREGWPNVLLEAMACGTPVAATPVWGCREIVTDPAAGVLSKSRCVEDIREAINRLLDDPQPTNVRRSATRAFAEKFSWEETSERLDHLFTKVTQSQSALLDLKQKPLIGSSSGSRPKLLVTVDTEEAFNWSEFDNIEWRVPPPEDIAHFQSLCESLQVKPLYFLTYPILNDAPSAEYFKGLYGLNKAHFGLHMHQWVTPPLDDDGTFKGVYYSWQRSLPDETVEKKFQTLGKKFTDVFGVKATSHRAGRYGVSLSSYKTLSAAGIHHDFSPSPGFDFSREGGPNFKHFSNKAFLISHQQGNQIYVFPASGARAIRGGSIFLKQRQYVGFSDEHSHRLSSSVVPTPQFTAPIRLSPEGNSLEDLKALAKNLASNNVAVSTLSLHSTTLTEGANDYGPTRADIDAFLEKTRTFLTFYSAEVGDVISYSDLNDLFPAHRASNDPNG